MFWSYKPTRLLLLCAAVTTGWSSVSQAVLVAHYKFDEVAGSATTANTVAANGGNGTVGASVVLGVAGVDGTAVQLPRINTDAGMINMGAAGNAAGVLDPIAASGQITMTYWMKVESGVNSGNRNVAVSLGSNANNNSYIDSGIRGDAAALGAVYGRNRPNTGTAATIGDITGPVITTGEFHHIALTVDTETDTGSFYVDGVLAATETNAAKYGAFPALNGLLVGRLYRQGITDAFGGVIDDLQLYSSATSARDISRLFQNPGLTLEDIGPSIPGDTNDDGTVDVADFNLLRDNLGYSGLPRGLGADIVGNDGVIDFRDLRFFQDNFPAIVAAAGAQAVPEPSTIVMSLFALGVVASVARGRFARSATH
ncbi:LamG-like jellyroll fold domain-containing protein [Aeoliella sp. SH292]|uniref:LamG-like jellyroll fold domain-containing protein n=1 Tax=Aeoliella sp. SH292 TaxID=3454464 RepID=UPI003F990187